MFKAPLEHIIQRHVASARPGFYLVAAPYGAGKYSAFFHYSFVSHMRKFDNHTNHKTTFSSMGSLDISFKLPQEKPIVVPKIGFENTHNPSLLKHVLRTEPKVPVYLLCSDVKLSSDLLTMGCQLMVHPLAIRWTPEDVDEYILFRKANGLPPLDDRIVTAVNLTGLPHFIHSGFYTERSPHGKWVTPEDLTPGYLSKFFHEWDAWKPLSKNNVT